MDRSTIRVKSKGENGPACETQSAHIQFGGLSMLVAQAMKKAA